MAKFEIGDILNPVSRREGREKLEISWLPIEEIFPNPKNEIYSIGDLSQLEASIQMHGLMQPITVRRRPGGGYEVISGHRRLMACQELRQNGDADGLDALPCVIVADQGEAADELMLVMANSTARILTDYETLQQYARLKSCLEQMKENGYPLKGRLRDILAQMTGSSATKLARYNAILENLRPELMEEIRQGRLGLTRAYEISKIKGKWQKAYYEQGHIPLPRTFDEVKLMQLVGKLLEDKQMESVLRGVDWSTNDCVEAARRAFYSVLENRSRIFDNGQARIRTEVPEGQRFVFETLDSDGDVDGRRVVYAYNLVDLLRQSLGIAETKSEVGQQEAVNPLKERALRRRTAAKTELESYARWEKVLANQRLRVDVYEKPLTNGGRIYAVEYQAEASRRGVVFRYVPPGGQYVPEYQSYSSALGAMEKQLGEDEET